MAAWLATATGSVGIYKLIVLAPVAFVIAFFVFYFIGLCKTERRELQQLVSSIKFFRTDPGFSKN
jgi:hypothetical protein